MHIFIDKRREIVSKVKKSQDRAKDLINQMKIEANSIAKPDIKADLQKRVTVRCLSKTTTHFYLN